ncbi:MAG: hypothetical protein Q8R57_04835 [Bacteroidota bacterium]|nr:hypothetical protein [Bacteroidota bacterium]
METNKHIWRFETIGGVRRVNLNSGADLVALESLDQKLWTALSCPVNGLEIDPHTLQLIDTNQDEQIRVPEILAAVKWVLGILKDPNDLLVGSNRMPLNSINEKSEKGREILASARIILKNLGKSEQEYIELEDTIDSVQIFAGTAFNGDGIITVDSTSKTDLQKAIQDIIACMGSVQDRGGKEGIDEPKISTFFEACTSYQKWQQQKLDISQKILPFGENTAIAYELFLEVRKKIDDYFLRCKLAAFDPDTTHILNQLHSQVEHIVGSNLSEKIEEIKGYPLAKIEANKNLNLLSGINPIWESKLKKFHELFIGSTSKEISENDWQAIQKNLEPYAEWCYREVGSDVAMLGIDRIEELLNSNTKTELLTLVEEDKALYKEAESMMEVNKLLQYHRDLFTLLRNFVSFNDFYTPNKKAIFQSGTLYIDQRSCELCLKVNDISRHHNLVSYSNMFLIYCKCIAKADGEEMIIVAALTNGDITNLIVGRNALFYDRSGKDWDATIIKIIDNPISIRQAFFTPYRKISNFISTQVEKFAAAQDEKVQHNVKGGINKTAEKMEEKTQSASEEVDAESLASDATKFDIGKFVGIFAAISIALGALGGALASIIGGFLALVWWKMPLAILAIILLISTPSMLIAYLKLRKRNLAPLLDANGWAINAQATVNIKFGNLLTQFASIPLNSELNLNDPFSKKGMAPWKVAVIIGFAIGVILFLIAKLIFHFF